MYGIQNEYLSFSDFCLVYYSMFYGKPLKGRLINKMPPTSITSLSEIGSYLYIKYEK